MSTKTIATQAEPVDRLSPLMERFRLRAHLFHAGELCGVTHFDAQPGRGFLHVLQRGEMTLTHPSPSAQIGTQKLAPKTLQITEPTLLFYPRPLAHAFHNAPSVGADFVCATLDFQGGDQHPLVRALPPVLVLPLHAVAGLAPTLSLLFGEAQQVLCGRRLLADRLFEVLVLQLLRWLLDHPEQADMPPGLLLGLAHPKLARALTAMHALPGRAWPLQAMADAAGMSRSAFAAAFALQLGQTPAEYLQQWRVAIAQTLLSGGTSIKTASDQLGYASPASLSRAFAQVVGLSPRAWLKGQAAGLE